MSFYIYECKEKKQLEKLINDRCGSLVGFPTRRSISFAPFHIKSVKFEVFSINFIFDCCKENKLLDLKLYRLTKIVKYAGFDPMYVLKGRKLWPFKICQDFYRNGSKTQKCNEIEPSAPVTNNTRSNKTLGNLENPRFQNYPQLGTILEASSKPRTPGNTFVDSEMNIAAQNGLDVCEAKKIESTDLFKCGSKFSDSSCTNLLNSYIIPTIEATSKEKGNYFSAHNNREVEEKNNIISDIENKSLKFEMKKTNHNFMKGYYLPLLETNELKINKSNHNIKKGRNINCVYDNIEEELSIKQSKRCKCHSSNISETKEKVLYNQRQSSTDQMEKERYTQTHSNKLSDNFTGSFSTAQSNYRSKQSTNMKSKTNKSRHFVCSVACEHNLSDVMEKLQTSFSSKKKCDEFISGRENSSMSTLIQDYFNDFSSSSDSSLDECCESIFEPSLTCADDVQNIIEGSETRFQRKKLHEQFDSDHVSDTSLNTASWMNNEDRVTEQPSTSIIDNYVSICEEKCKHFSNEHPSSASTFNQKQNLTEIFNVDVDNVPVSFKSNNQSLNTEKTMNYVLSPMDEDVQAISTQPENYNDWGGETKISNEFTLVGNNTFKFSNEILSLIKDNFTQHTKSDYILHHVKNSFIQSLLLEVHQRSYLSNFTSYDLICGAILCQPLLKLISEDLHNKHKTILTSSNEQNQNNKTCINENLYNISSNIIIHEDNVEACHSEQPQLTKQTNDTSNSESFPQVNCFLESAEGQEKSESVLFYPIINKVYEKNELYRDNSKSVSKCIEIPIYDDDDALNTGNSWDSKYTTISRKLPKFSENSDTEDVALTDNELLGNQYPISKIIPPVGKAFPNSQCNYSDASSVPIHFELVKRKLEVASNNEATSDFERRCVNNNSDDSYIKQTNTPYLIRELPTSDQLTDSIPSKDNKIKGNGREKENSCERKEINYSLLAEDCNHLNDGEVCFLLADGSDTIKNIDDIHYPTYASSQESLYFAGISPDVDLVIPHRQ